MSPRKHSFAEDFDSKISMMNASSPFDTENKLPYGTKASHKSLPMRGRRGHIDL
jgi:hypothetical protein